MFTKPTRTIAIMTLTVFCFTQVGLAGPAQNLRKETTAEAGGKNELVVALAEAGGPLVKPVIAAARGTAHQPRIASAVSRDITLPDDYASYTNIVARGRYLFAARRKGPDRPLDIYNLETGERIFEELDAFWGFEGTDKYAVVNTVLDNIQVIDLASKTTKMTIENVPAANVTLDTDSRYVGYYRGLASEVEIVNTETGESVGVIGAVDNQFELVGPYIIYVRKESLIYGPPQLCVYDFVNKKLLYSREYHKGVFEPIGLTDAHILISIFITDPKSAHLKPTTMPLPPISQILKINRLTGEVTKLERKPISDRYGVMPFGIAGLQVDLEEASVPVSLKVEGRNFVLTCEGPSMNVMSPVASKISAAHPRTAPAAGVEMSIEQARDRIVARAKENFRVSINFGPSPIDGRHTSMAGFWAFSRSGDGVTDFKDTSSIDKYLEEIAVSGKVLVEETEASISIRHPVAGGVAGWSDLKVLIVDDEEYWLSEPPRILKIKGVATKNMRTASSAEEAIAILEVWKPDIIISGWGMDVRKDDVLSVNVGRALVEHVAGTIPVIVVTNSPLDVDLAQEKQQNWVRDIIKKSQYMGSTLCAAVERIMGFSAQPAPGAGSPGSAAGRIQQLWDEVKKLQERETAARKVLSEKWETFIAKKEVFVKLRAECKTADPDAAETIELLKRLETAHQEVSKALIDERAAVREYSEIRGLRETKEKELLAEINTQRPNWQLIARDKKVVVDGVSAADPAFTAIQNFLVQEFNFAAENIEPRESMTAEEIERLRSEDYLIIQLDRETGEYTLIGIGFEWPLPVLSKAPEVQLEWRAATASYLESCV